MFWAGENSGPGQGEILNWDAENMKKRNIAGHRVNQRFMKGCTTAGVFFREPLFCFQEYSVLLLRPAGKGGRIS